MKLQKKKDMQFSQIFDSETLKRKKKVGKNAGQKYLPIF